MGGSNILDNSVVHQLNHDMGDDILSISEGIGQKRKSEASVNNTTSALIDQYRNNEDSFTIGGGGSVEGFNSSLSKTD